MRAVRTVLGTIAASVVSSVLGIGTAVAGMGVWALAIQQLSYQFTNVVANAFQVDWHPRLVFHANRAKKLFLLVGNC